MRICQPLDFTLHKRNILDCEITPPEHYSAPYSCKAAIYFMKVDRISHSRDILVRNFQDGGRRGFDWTRNRAILPTVHEPPPNQTWSGSDDPLPRYVRLNFSNMVAIKDTRKVFAPNQGYFGVGQSNGVVQISVRLTLIAMASNWFYLDTKWAITQLVWSECKKTFQFETHCKDDVMISIY